MRKCYQAAAFASYKYRLSYFTLLLLLLLLTNNNSETSEETMNTSKMFCYFSLHGVFGISGIIVKRMPGMQKSRLLQSEILGLLQVLHFPFSLHRSLFSVNQPLS